jgi:hypothetical protein
MRLSAAMKNGLPKVRGDEVHNGRVWVGLEFNNLAIPYLNGFGLPTRTLQEVNLGLPKAVRERERPKNSSKTVF